MRFVTSKDSPRCFSIEPLESRRFFSAGGTSHEFYDSPSPIFAPAAITAPRRVYLIGNSMTDGIRYNGLTMLLGRDGAAVSLGRQTGPGFTQAQNLALAAGYATTGVDPARPGNLNPWGNYQQAFAGAWDALSLQPADRRILVDNHTVNGVTQNQADVPMAMEFMKQFAAHNSAAQVYIYSRPSRRTDLNTQSQPNGITFDYNKEWSKTYIESGAGTNFNVISRSYITQYMTALRAAQKTEPLTKNMKSVRLIPAGEAFYNLDRMLKAGKFAGTYVTSMTDFYADGSHPRGDTGSYLIALCFYAALTGNDPRGVAPNSSYLNPAPGVGAGKVQSLIQQAVYDAFAYSGYAGWTTPLPGMPTTTVGRIRVTVFADKDRDGMQDTGEAGVPNVKVFLDTDNDGKLDTGETSATTNFNGQIIFANLPVGSYRVRTVTTSSMVTTSANPVLTSVLANATRDTRTGWAVKLGSISGKLFSDSDKDGKLDAGEQLLAGRTVFIDLDNDNVLDAHERRVTTDASGSFRFDNLAAGTYRIKRVLPGGYKITTPAATITLTTGQTFSGVLIGAGKL